MLENEGESCIVCLSSLVADTTTLTTATTTATTSHDPVSTSVSKSPALAADTAGRHYSDTRVASQELIATLLPCHHYLHDACLKPWVDRANSCPMCRATFNQVELRATINGDILDSYAVQDKRQQADIDPSLVIDEDPFEEDTHTGPCMVCESHGNEEELLLCDGCDNTTHVCCAGLDRVPPGAWFCYACTQGPQNVVRARHPTTSSRHAHDGRELGWARVWRSVFNRLNFDLDFPFDEEESTPSDRQRNEANQHEFRQWRRRFEVAARQGAATRFRNTVNTLNDPAPPHPRNEESQEEIRAWNAFDKARTLHEGRAESPGNTGGRDSPGSARRRKRKSRSSTPQDPREATPPATERKLKRPRFAQRRPVDVSTTVAAVPSSSSSSSRIAAEPTRPANVRITAAPVAQRIHQRQRSIGTPQRVEVTGGPTFLQSLLNEVEAHPTPGTSDGDAFNESEGDSGRERSMSPQTSRDASPVASNYATPRSRSPVPHSPVMRPTSPSPLSSIISPVFPPAPEYSPFSPAVDEKSDRARARQRKPRIITTSAGPRYHSSSPDQSPTRAPVSYEMKQEIQKIVAGALKPYYARKEVDKDAFTEINRRVSRGLYDRIWDAGGLVDQKSRERWEVIAGEEVKLAVATTAKTNTVDIAVRSAPVQA